MCYLLYKEMRRIHKVALTLQRRRSQPLDSPTTPVLSEVSLNSVLGLTSPKTFKMKGSVLGHDVVVMVDPGATHNFISLSTVEKIGIPVVSTKEFGVTLGTGDPVKGFGECKDVLLVVQGLEKLVGHYEC